MKKKVLVSVTLWRANRKVVSTTPVKIWIGTCSRNLSKLNQQKNTKNPIRNSVSIQKLSHPCVMSHTAVWHYNTGHVMSHRSCCVPQVMLCPTLPADTTTAGQTVRLLEQVKGVVTLGYSQQVNDLSYWSRVCWHNKKQINLWECPYIISRVCWH